MRRNSSGLNLEIARWILERGDAVSAYDVAKQFGVTIRQAVGLMSSIVTDNAMETQTGLIIPDRPDGRHRSQYVRSVRVFSIDRETISDRRTKAQHHRSYHAKGHQSGAWREMSQAEKWAWVISNARKRKR